MLGPSAREILCTPSRVESLFPPVLWSSCTQVLPGFEAKCSGGSTSQCQPPRLGSLMRGSELTAAGVPLPYNDFPVLWVAHLVTMRFDYIAKAPPTISL